MRVTLLFSLFLFMTQSSLIFDFNSTSDLRNWQIVDDGVMGGRSEGNFAINEAGHGKFFGAISLDNYGGFSSLRYSFKSKSVSDHTFIKLVIKGDGNNFQFRVKESRNQYFSYIYEFSTSGEWEEILIPLSDMFPSFRGRKLDMPNFSSDSIEEVTFLRANKREEYFEILIDKIEFQ